MTILVTGTSGQLGRLVVASLLERGVPAADIVATARDTSTIADLAEQGVVVRPADYTDPHSLTKAFDGVDTLLLVSSSEVGQRAEQHANVVTAAALSGVSLIAYTSIANAPTSSLGLAVEHRATEQAILESGIPYVFLRNGWYLENYLDQLPTYLEHGVAGAAGDGQVSPATRADFADAAAVVISTPGHEGQAYELGGPAFTLTELADEVTTVTGSAVTYTNLPEDVYAQVLVSAGLPEAFAQLLADSDRGLAEGDLFVDGDDLERLIGRRPTTLAEGLRGALATSAA